MNQLRTARVPVSLRNALLALTILVLVCGTQAAAQQSLGDLLAESGFEWMSGKWLAETDDGQELQLVFKWELDGHVISVHFKSPEFEYRGIILYKAAEEQVVQVGADDQSGSARGTWVPDGDRAILKHERTGAWGETERMGIAQSKVDDNTMRWEIYELYSDGQLAVAPNFTIEFNRQKEKACKTEG